MCFLVEHGEMGFGVFPAILCIQEGMFASSGLAVARWGGVVGELGELGAGIEELGLAAAGQGD